jgi:hypothetical protein
MKEALKEILRIVQTNGGLNKGDEINITYCTGLWRIEPIAKDALRKEAQANARLIARAPELLEQCKLFEKLLTVMIMEGDSGADLERDNLRAILDRVEGESA